MLPKILIANRGAFAGLALAIGVAVSAPALGQPPLPSQPIEIGTSFTLQSKSLGEARTVNIVLPAGYAKHPDRRYQVLYLIDGGVDQDLIHIAGVEQLGAAWGRSGDAIIVGIETKDRRKELVGPTSDPELLKKYPTAGSSAAFRAYIRDEVKPFVERNYRTDGTDAVIGESLAGLFIVETYLAEPALFDAYGAISPSLWWDKEALSKTVAARLGDRQKGRRLYLAAADEGPEMVAPVRRLVDGLKAKERGWCFVRRDDLSHSTIYQQLSPQALQYLLPPAEAPPPEYGFKVQCTEKVE
jgi:predicted alpha/beta superfamily hydrolase